MTIWEQNEINQQYHQHQPVTEYNPWVFWLLDGLFAVFSQVYPHWLNLRQRRIKRLWRQEMSTENLATVVDSWPAVPADSQADQKRARKYYKQQEFEVERWTNNR
ncbi:MAG: hypothetical protein AAFV85_27205 [Cyanobacteria bacterium J06634_6]